MLLGLYPLLQGKRGPGTLKCSWGTAAGGIWPYASPCTHKSIKDSFIRSGASSSDTGSTLRQSRATEPCPVQDGSSHLPWLHRNWGIRALVGLELCGVSLEWQMVWADPWVLPWAFLTQIWVWGWVLSSGCVHTNTAQSHNSSQPLCPPLLMLQLFQMCTSFLWKFFLPGYFRFQQSRALLTVGNVISAFLLLALLRGLPALPSCSQGRICLNSPLGSISELLGSHTAWENAWDNFCLLAQTSLRFISINLWCFFLLALNI